VDPSSSRSDDAPRQDGGWQRRYVPPSIGARANVVSRAIQSQWRLFVVVGAIMVLGGVAGLAVSCAPRQPAPPPVPVYTPVSLSALPGWAEDQLDQARPALARSCGVFLKRDAARPLASADSPAAAVVGRMGAWQALCRRLATVPPKDGPAFRAFLEANVQAFSVTPDQGPPTGLFTGYYEAHIRAARQHVGPYQYPVYGVPKDLVTENGQGRRMVDGRPVPYLNRAAIETGALDGKAPVLLWADDPVDLHILHIQGSGQVTLAEGGQTRIGYAGNNGQPFVGIGRLVRERGLADGGSMPAIRAWLRAHPQDGQALMRENPRYIFFREISGDGPIGALGVPLEPSRSLAVDPNVVPLGVPVWLATTDPEGRPLRRLMVAQDTGSAIRGIVRGDIFWGSGEAAFHQAGRMKNKGRYYIIAPRPQADNLRLM